MAGAIMGMLMAPDTGEVTRQKAKKAGDKLMKEGMKAFDQFQEDQIEPFLDRVGERADDVKADIEDKFEEVKNELVKRMETRKAGRSSTKTAEKV